MPFARRLRALRRAFFASHKDSRLIQACHPERLRIACIEDLELRRLLSTSYSAGALSISLSSASTVSISISGTGTVVVTENGIPTDTGAALSAISSISVTGSSGNDNINLSYVTAAHGFTNGSLSGNISVSGNAGDDIIYGTGLADSISGGDGGDELFGNAGDDTLLGEDGNDLLIGDAGNDILDAGAGTTNTVTYTNDPAGVSVVVNSVATDGYGDTDTLSNFQLTYGSNYADSIIGSAGNDTIDGKAGNDTINGAGGDDWIVGEAGNDSLDGGSGNNAINYGYGPSGVSVVLNSYAIDGWGDTDTLSNFRYLYGSPYADSLVGSSGNEDIHGQDGNDTIIGNGGNDYLDGGNGTDTLSYSTSTSAVNVTLNSSASDGFGNTDTLVNFEILAGSSYADTLTGSSGNDSIYGGDGNDILAGGSGSDYLSGDNGDDSLSANGGDTLYSNAGDDIISSSAGANTLHGTSGNDTVSVTGGTLTADTSQLFSSISISSGAELILDSGAGPFITSSFSSSGTLDITDNQFAIDYAGSSPFSTIRTAITAGYDSGAWDGAGIISSTAAADPSSAHGVGYAENSDLAWSTLGSQSIDSSTLVVEYTYYGDANLDNDITPADFRLVHAGAATNVAIIDSTDRADNASWYGGDFNYDSLVDPTDLQTLYTAAINYSSVAITSAGTFDGSTDDSADIQSTIDGAPDGTIILIPGIAAIGSSGLHIADRTDLVLLGSSLYSGFNITAVAPQGAALGDPNSALLITGCSYCTIADLEFSANNYESSMVSFMAANHSGTLVYNSYCALSFDFIHDVGVENKGVTANAVNAAVESVGSSHNYYFANSVSDTGWSNTNGVRGFWLGNTQSGFLETYHTVAWNSMTNTGATAYAGEPAYATFAYNTADTSGGAGIALGSYYNTNPYLDDPTGHALVIDSRAHDILVIGNNFDNMGFQGVQADQWGDRSDPNAYVYNVVVINNTFNNSYDSGIYAYYAHNWTILNNTLEDNGHAGITTGVAADIYIGRDSEDNSGPNFISGGGSGIKIVDGSSTVLVADNDIEDVGLYGVFVGASYNNVSYISIDNNTIIDSAQDGIHLETSGSYTATNISITYNSISDIGGSTYSGILIRSGTDTVTISNNDIENVPGGIGFFVVSGGVADNFTIDDNVIVNSSVGGIALVTRSGGYIHDVDMTSNSITGTTSYTSVGLKLDARDSTVGIYNISFTDNSIDQSQYGIVIDAFGPTIDSVLIQSNSIDDSYESGAYIEVGSGSITNLTIDDNDITDSGHGSGADSGVVLYAHDSGTMDTIDVTNNRIHTANYFGLLLNAYPGASIDNVTIDSNDFTSYTSWGILVEHSGTGSYTVLNLSTLGMDNTFDSSSNAVHIV